MFRFLYNHNPFYVISAGFLLYGVKLIFRPGEVEYIDPWHLLIAISCVTLAIASAAFGIVRLGKVWEDARSIILVLLLMFLAISVSFDEILNTHSWEAFRLLLAGFVFLVTVSEVLLLGLGIRLPGLYRVPYYLFLALFFGYPVWASPEFCELKNEVIQWRVALFPTVAAAITLALIPAIRKGRALCENNGTPWKWPLFPWCLFVFLGLAVCFRSWSLSISLDTGLIRTSIRAMDSAFGLYLLVPFFLAAMFVLLEMAIVENSAKLRRFVLWAAPVVLLISIPRLWPMSHHGSFQRFLAAFVTEIGSPILLAILGLLAFYAIAWLRGVRSAENGFVAMCVAAVFVGPRATGFGTDNLQTWSLVAMGCLMLTNGLARRSSWYSFLGGSSLAIAFGLHLPGTILEAWQATTVFHLILGVVLLCGGLFKDDFAKKLRVLGAVVLPLVFFTSLNTVTRFPLAFELMLLYGAAITLVAFGCWHFMKERLYLYAGLVNCLAGTGFGSVSLYRWLQRIASPEGVPLCSAWAALRWPSSSVRSREVCWTGSDDGLRSTRLTRRLRMPDGIRGGHQMGKHQLCSARNLISPNGGVTCQPGATRRGVPCHVRFLLKALKGRSKLVTPLQGLRFQGSFSWGVASPQAGLFRPVGATAECVPTPLGKHRFRTSSIFTTGRFG